MQNLRRERRLPRWVVFHENDNTLVTDLDNPLSVDALIHVLPRTSAVALTEFYPGLDELCTQSEEGRFCHELNVPMVLRPRVLPTEVDHARRDRASIATAAPVDRMVRALPPGSEWLYVKLYGGNVLLDEVLTSAIPGIIEEATGSGALSRWFFIRYSDPKEHLRIRFNGSPGRLQRDVMPLVAASLNPLLAAGIIERIQFDTYEREIERYGGPEAVVVSEDCFFADSVTALQILRESSSGNGQDARWRAALCGVDQLLSDFGLDLGARLVTVTRWRDHHHAGAPSKQLLAHRFRSERRRLEELLWPSGQPDGDLQSVRAAFSQRSERMTSVVQSLRSLGTNGRLGVPISDLIASYAHMHVNRMIRSAANTHEVVIYDFLSQLYKYRIARMA